MLNFEKVKAKLKDTHIEFILSDYVQDYMYGDIASFITCFIENDTGLYAFTELDIQDKPLVVAKKNSKLYVISNRYIYKPFTPDINHTQMNTFGYDTRYIVKVTKDNIYFSNGRFSFNDDSHIYTLSNMGVKLSDTWFADLFNYKRIVNANDKGVSVTPDISFDYENAVCIIDPDNSYTMVGLVESDNYTPVLRIFDLENNRKISFSFYSGLNQAFFIPQTQTMICEFVDGFVLLHIDFENKTIDKSLYVENSQLTRPFTIVIEGDSIYLTSNVSSKLETIDSFDYDTLENHIKSYITDIHSTDSILSEFNISSLELSDLSYPYKEESTENFMIGYTTSTIQVSNKKLLYQSSVWPISIESHISNHNVYKTLSVSYLKDMNLFVSSNNNQYKVRNITTKPLVQSVYPSISILEFENNNIVLALITGIKSFNEYIDISVNNDELSEYMDFKVITIGHHESTTYIGPAIYQELLDRDHVNLPDKIPLTVNLYLDSNNTISIDTEVDKDKLIQLSSSFDQPFAIIPKGTEYNSTVIENDVLLNTDTAYIKPISQIPSSRVHIIKRNPLVSNAFQYSSEIIDDPTYSYHNNVNPLTIYSESGSSFKSLVIRPGKLSQLFDSYPYGLISYFEMTLSDLNNSEDTTTSYAKSVDEIRTILRNLPLSTIMNVKIKAKTGIETLDSKLNPTIEFYSLNDPVFVQTSISDFNVQIQQNKLYYVSLSNTTSLIYAIENYKDFSVTNAIVGYHLDTTKPKYISLVYDSVHDSFYAYFIKQVNLDTQQYSAIKFKVNNEDVKKYATYDPDANTISTVKLSIDSAISLVNETRFALNNDGSHDFFVYGNLNESVYACVYNKNKAIAISQDELANALNVNDLVIHSGHFYNDGIILYVADYDNEIARLLFIDSTGGIKDLSKIPYVISSDKPLRLYTVRYFNKIVNVFHTDNQILKWTIDYNKGTERVETLVTSVPLDSNKTLMDLAIGHTHLETFQLIRSHQTNYDIFYTIGLIKDISNLDSQILLPYSGDTSKIVVYAYTVTSLATFYSIDEAPIVGHVNLHQLNDAITVTQVEDVDHITLNTRFVKLVDEF